MEEPTLGSLDWTCHEAGNLSSRQVLRMANEGKFPQAVRVTEGNERQKGRIAFVRSEVRTWVAERIAKRDNARSDRAAAGSLAKNDGWRRDAWNTARSPRGGFKGPAESRS